MSVTIHHGDALEVLRTLPPGSVQCCVTSPPYWAQRDYGGGPLELGLEKTPEEYVERLSEVLGEVRRVLVSTGTLWLNLAGCYNTCSGGAGPNSSRLWLRRRRLDPKVNGYGLRVRGLPRKSYIGVPWMVALRLQADGWVLRSEVLWAKPNPVPEQQVKDRPTRAHEQVFFFSAGPRYQYDRGSEASDTTVWEIPAEPTRVTRVHTATYPTELARRCIVRSCPPGDTVLDPFAGAGTTGLVADRLGRDAVLIELNREYVEMSRKRIYEDAPMFADVAVREAGPKGEQ